MLPLPLWQSVVLVIRRAMFVYVGLAFFLRPEPDGDNMGWCGGVLDDPFHYSDDINRLLFGLADDPRPRPLRGRNDCSISARCSAWWAVWSEQPQPGAAAPADQQAFAEREYEVIARAGILSPDGTVECPLLGPAFLARPSAATRVRRALLPVWLVTGRSARSYNRRATRAHPSLEDSRAFARQITSPTTSAHRLLPTPAADGKWNLPSLPP